MFVLDNLFLLYFLSGWFVVVLIIIIIRMTKTKVWIKTHTKGGMYEIGYLNYQKGEASEIFISGGNQLPIGRVKLDESREKNGVVDILSGGYAESTGKPSYRVCGYVTEEGYIYKKTGKNGKPERIGYTARPSSPNVPTSIGERSWRTLWLVCTLNAYMGKPAAQMPEASDDLELSKKHNSSSHFKTLVFNDLSENENSETPEPAEPTPDPSIESIDGHNLAEPVVETPISELVTPVGETASDAQPKSVPTNEPVKVDDNQIVEENSEINKDDNGVQDPKKETNSAEGGREVITEDAEEENATETKEDTESEEGQEKQVGKEKQDEQEKQDDKNKEEEEGKQGGKKKEKKSRKNNKDNVRQPFAVCKYYGFHNSRHDILSPESRAGAFALLFDLYNKNSYEEYYKSKPYGWLDTALLTSFVYSILYLLAYAVFTFLLKKPFVGMDEYLMLEFMALYFAMWALIRQIKIMSIENLSSIQTRIDLFNKSLGLGFFDYSIIIFGILSLSFVDNYYYLEYDFWPLAFAIIMGFTFNLFSRSSKERWVIKNTLSDDEDYVDDEEVKNPAGDIARTYDWDLDPKVSDSKLHGNVTLYFTAAHITDLRQFNPFFSQLKEKSDKEYILEMFHEMKEHKTMLARLRYVADYIKKLCEKHGLHELDKIQFVLDFVQEPNIKFCMNQDSEAVNRLENYIRYPDETLYDKEGDSNSKALLAAMLFNLLRYNVLYMHSTKQQHAAIGVEIKPEWVNILGAHKTIEEITLDYNNRKYVFCETTGDKFRIVEVMNGMRYEDFEDRIELQVVEANVDDNNLTNTMETRFYNWDLDSELGNKLHGTYTLEFDTNDINELRKLNPFYTYGEDGVSYEQNVRRIFGFLLEDEDRMSNVNCVIKYIKEASAGLPSLDLAQFTLDFVQAPNITYKVDEDSDSINSISHKVKEYMRFPDEVLFDKEGDCDCKASLAAAMFHSLGYNVCILLSEKLQHTAIAIECSDEWMNLIRFEDKDDVILEYNGTTYVYCETTGDGYRIGHIKEGDSIRDFETIIEICN